MKQHIPRFGWNQIDEGVANGGLSHDQGE